MKIVAQEKTDKGNVRENNEDFFCVEDAIGLYAVADGIGGLAAGEIASRMAIDVIRDYINNPQKKNVSGIKNCSGYSEETNNICMAVKLANKAIYEASNSAPEFHGMGTTIATVLIKEDRLSIAHAGDSRVYLVRGNNIEQLTDDHSLVAEQMGNDFLIEIMGENSNMKNIITRSLGAQIDVDVAINEMTLFNGDILILCSDGLTTMVPDRDILSIVTSTNNTQKACDMLIDLAKKNGGRDNITVIVIYIYKNKLFYIINNLLRLIRR